MEIDDEPMLRLHIRNLLLRYSLTHLTTNYVTHTRSKVSEILSECLAVVPEDDPTSLLLPLEPFDILSRKLRLKDLHSYDQKWEPSVESNTFIKQVLFADAGNSPTEKYWGVGDDNSYLNPDIPMSPVLTTRAIRETPKLASLPRPFASLKSFGPHFIDNANLRSVHNEAVIETNISAQERDQLLGLRPKIDIETHQAINSIIRQIPAALPRPKNSTQDFAAHETRMVSAFLQGANTPPLKTLDYPLSPPVFPRHLAQSNALCPEKLSDISTLSLVTKIKVEEDQEDISAANMLVVDGWNVLAPPPTSQGASSNTPSLDHGSVSSPAQIDELFALTPPPQIVPRDKMGIRKPRGGRKKDRELQSLAAFLSSIIPTAPSTSLRDLPEAPRNKSPMLSESMVGLPPSSPPAASGSKTSNQISSKYPVMEGGFAGLDPFITELCKPVEGQSAEDLILKERVDEKEALMMDVPKLSEPNQHPPSPSCPAIPASFRGLLASAKDNSALHSDFKPTVSCFKKVSGLQSLNIDLTWRPFNFGTSVPRTEELADVEHLPTVDFETTHNADYCEARLKDLLSEFDAQEIRGSVFADPPLDWKTILGDTSCTVEVILTRAERRRLADNGRHVFGIAEMQEEDFTVTPEPEHRTRAVPSRSHKKMKLDLQADSRAPLLSVPEEASHSPGLAAVLDAAPLLLTAQQSLEQDRATQVLPLEIPVCSTTENDDCISVDREESLELLDAPSGRSGVPVENTQLVLSEFSNGLSNPDALEITAGLFPDPQASALSPSAQLPADSQSVRMHPQKLPVGFQSDFDEHATASRHAPPSKAVRLESASAQQTLSDFMNLRGKPHEPTALHSSPPEPSQITVPPSSPRGFPSELQDTDMLTLPESWTAPPLRHRYIASLDLIQKRVLLRHLASATCNVDLVERETCGADLITDADTALLFVPLAPLPAACEALAVKLAALSWDFARLVVVFECFSSSLSYRAPRDGDGNVSLTPYAYSPPVIKAVRKLKRLLKISEAMETSQKREATVVWYAYATDPGEAAKFARIVGDAPVYGTGGVHEVARDWLTDEFAEDEMDLAQVRGMNAFASAMLLRCVDITTLIEMSPDDRLLAFSEMVGEPRMRALNEEIANRLAAVACLSSPLRSQDQETAISSYMEPLEGAYEGGLYSAAGMIGDSSLRAEGLPEDDMDWPTTGLLMIEPRTGARGHF